MSNLNTYPLLMKRKHLKSLGFSDSLYYKLVKEKLIPTVTLNKRIYIPRDKLFDWIEQNTNLVKSDE